MFIDMNEIRGEGLVFEEEMRIPPLRGIADELILVDQAHVRGTATRGERGAELRGSLRGVLKLPCSRCNETFRTSFDVEFFLVLVATGERKDEEQPEEGDEDEARFDAPGGRADLVDIISEQIYLQIPLKPICAEDCKGLCSVCGANRNSTECGCIADRMDPRLLPLLGLRDSRSRS